MPEFTRRPFLGSLLGGVEATVLADPALTRSERHALLVLECHVAGTTYRPYRLTDIEPYLASGGRLLLEREPSNPADTLAIAVYHPPRYHLGYIPRVDNQVLARLMDAGLLAQARLESKQWVGNWLKLQVSVALSV